MQSESFSVGEIAIVASTHPMWSRYVGTECEVIGAGPYDFDPRYHYEVRLCDGLEVYAANSNLRKRRPPQDWCNNWPCAKSAGHAGPCSSSPEAPTSNEQLTVDQAVGMLLKTAGYVLSTEKADKLIAYIQQLDRLAFPAETPAPQKKCEWGFDAGDDVWHTGCGEMWTLTCNDLHANGLKFCPCCGREVDDLSRPAVKTSCESSTPSVAVVLTTEPSSSREGSGPAAGGADLETTSDAETCPKHGVKLAFPGDSCWACQEES